MKMKLSEKQILIFLKNTKKLSKSFRKLSKKKLEIERKNEYKNKVKRYNFNSGYILFCENLF